MSECGIRFCNPVTYKPAVCEWSQFVFHLSSPVAILLRYSLPSLWYHSRKVNAVPKHSVLRLDIRFSGTYLAHSFQNNRCFVMISCDSFLYFSATISWLGIQRWLRGTKRALVVPSWLYSQAAYIYDTRLQKLIPRHDKCYISDGS